MGLARTTQKQSAEEFQNLSTVSTLLSAVTATTILYTLPEADITDAFRATLLWVISLIFSTASAIQSQLAFYWLRHPRQESTPLSSSGSTIILTSPLTFFVIAIITFLGGLVAFSFGNFPDSSLPPVAVVCATIMLMAMGVSSYWRILEGWLSIRKPLKWENLRPWLSATAEEAWKTCRLSIIWAKQVFTGQGRPSPPKRGPGIFAPLDE